MLRLLQSWSAKITSTSSVKILRLLLTSTQNLLTSLVRYYAREAIKPLVDFIVSDEVLAVGKAERLERLYNERSAGLVHDPAGSGRLYPSPKSVCWRTTKTAMLGWTKSSSISLEGLLLI